MITDDPPAVLVKHNALLNWGCIKDCTCHHGSAQDNYLMLTDDPPAVLVKHNVLLNCGMDIDIYRLEI